MSTTAKDRLSTGSNITHRSEPTSLRSQPDETPSNPTADSKAIRSERSLRATVAAGNKDVEGGVRRKLSTVECLGTIVLASKLNILLVFVPLGIVAYQLNWSKVTIFVLNFIAIIPLARRKSTPPFELAVCLNTATSDGYTFFFLFCWDI
jgi:Ca2+:H+ antiporter